jgi:hypothetical protein
MREAEDGLKIVALSIVALLAATGAVVVERTFLPASVVASCGADGTTMARLELLFGLGKPDGSTVSEAEWQAFLATEITPRFPDGLTVLSAFGQWKGPSGVIAKESSRLLVVWYKRTSNTDANIESIRQAYKVRFGQASVMRVDGSSCVSF